MSQEIKTYEIELGAVTLNGEVCKDPIIELAGFENANINCIDPECGLYRVQVAPGDKACLTFIIKCEECDGCPAKIVEYCFCETIDDCEGCEDCIDGFCVSACETNEGCCDGVCCECEDDVDCPCNQVCIGGECGCPVGTTENESGCCDECQNDGDCSCCEECVLKDGYTQCLTLDCPCDDGGTCPTQCDCVECVNSGDCNGTNECCIGCECECCPGFHRVNGVCVPEPECDTDEDCEVCEVCISGKCRPRQCPPGRVAIQIGDDCPCVEECDCIDPDCSKRTDYCKPANATQCGCVPCEGSCEDGCVDPCYCDEATQECVYDPCEGSCTTGAECGQGCGCLDGECTSCALLDCDTTECVRALGCVCINDICQEDNCDFLPCSIASDCPFGCTCYQGRCVSCDNFSCITSDCTVQEGCHCVNGNCVGEEVDCTDVVEMEKDDANCRLTGRLIKDNCCACPELTVDTKGRVTGETDSSYTLDFIAEVRKGAWDGVSVNSVPRVDDFSNPNIAENEPPTSGTITLLYQITYNIYEIIDGQESFVDISEGTPQTVQSSFTSGTTAEVMFSGINLPKIGFRTQDGNVITEVAIVAIQFATANSLVFPNECTYAGGDIISRYVIDDNSEFTAFGATYSNAEGAIITTDTCRLPLFKWTKTDTDSFNAPPFRKIYIDGGPTYEDILDKEKGLESCKYYLLDIDCNCKEPISKYIVFCNPENLDFSVTPSICPTCLTINSFDTCDVNEEKEFYVEFGDQRITWIGDNAPVGQQFCSGESFEEVKFGLTCDILDQCTKIYEVQGTVLEPVYETTCSPDGTEFTVEFEQFDAEGECQIDYVVIGPYTLAGVLRKSLPIGSYTATVYWACGCEPTEVPVTEDCCNFQVSPIARNCDGSVICSQDSEVIYTVNGTVYTDICNFVENLDPSTSARILATKGGCIPIPINIPSLDSYCCENFSLSINQTSPTTATVTILNGTGDVVVTVDDPTVGVTDNGNGTWSLTNLVDGEVYVITATDGTCGAEDATLVAGSCNLTTDLSIDDDCKLVASINPQSCQCRVGTYTISILDVVDVGDRLQIFYETALGGFDAVPDEGELFINDNGMGSVEPDGYFFMDKPTVESEDCINSSMTITVSALTAASTTDVEITLKQGSTNVKDLAIVDSVSITVNGNTQTTVQSDGMTYLFPAVTGIGSSAVEVTVTVIDSDGFTYTFFYDGVMTPGQSINVVSPICKETMGTVFDLPVSFELKDLGLVDDCDYFDISQSFTVRSNGIILPSSTQILELTPENPTSRDVKFSWYKEGAFIYLDFDEVESVLPDELLEQGFNYSVVADCPPCSDADDILYCCVPELTYEILGCNDCIEFTLTGVPGEYQIDFNGQSEVVEIASGETSVTQAFSCSEPLPANSAITATVSVVGTTCEEDFTVNTVDGLSPLFTFPACSGSFYDILIANAQPTWQTNILSGSGTVAGNGYDILSIDEGDVPLFQITDTATDCQTPAIDGTRPTPCSVSSSVPVSSSGIGSSSRTPASSGSPSSSGGPSSSNKLGSSSGDPSSSAIPPSSGGTPSSSGAPSSSASPSSSEFDSSSNVPSSSKNPSSSEAPSSSMAPPSVFPSSMQSSSAESIASSSRALIPSTMIGGTSTATPSSSKAPSFPSSTGGASPASSSNAFSGCSFEGQACGSCGICRPLPGEPGGPYLCQANEFIDCGFCFDCDCVGTSYCDCSPNMNPGCDEL